MARRPKARALLEEAFRRAEHNGTAYEFLSSGISACLENAASLAKEFGCMASNGFNARAQFLMATAMEELGKALILFDFVRVPWDQKQLVAGLCAAFYNHLNKSAYAKTIYFTGGSGITEALILNKLELIEYWPNRDPESGEPHEYADGIIGREWGLYVDWNDFDGRWFLPIDSSLAYYYAQEEARPGLKVGEERIAGVLSQLVGAQGEGLFTAEALRRVHSVMSRLYVTTATPDQDIMAAVAEVGSSLLDIGVKLSDNTLHANFLCYPLYASILTPEKIKGYWEV